MTLYMLGRAFLRAVVEPVKKRDQIFVIGKRPEYVALAVDGVFRAFYVNEDDVEVTDCLVNLRHTLENIRRMICMFF